MVEFEDGELTVKEGTNLKEFCEKLGLKKVKDLGSYTVEL